MKTEHDFVAEVARQVNYAAKSFSIELVSLSSTICRDWLNNGRWNAECDRFCFDVNDSREEIRKAILKEKGIE